MKRLVAISCLGLAALSGGAARAREADPFYLGLLREGIAELQRGETSDAVEALQIACFGLLEEPKLLAEGLVNLALAQAKLDDAKAFRTTFDRLAMIEGRFHAFSEAAIPEETRSALAAAAARFVPPSALAATPGFEHLAAEKTRAELAKLSPRQRRKEIERRLKASPGDPVLLALLAELDPSARPPAPPVSPPATSQPAAPPPAQAAGSPASSEPAASQSAPAAVPSAPPAVPPAAHPGSAAPAEPTAPAKPAPPPPAAAPASGPRAEPPAQVAPASPAAAPPSASAPPQPAPPQKPPSTPPPAASAPPQSSAPAPPQKAPSPPAAQTPAASPAPPSVAAKPPSPAAPPLSPADSAKLVEAREILGKARVAADLDRASAIARQVADARPDSPEAQLLAGEIAYRASRFAEAARYLTASGAAIQARPSLLFYLAVAQYESGDLAGARKSLAASLNRIQRTPFVERYVDKINGAPRQP